MTVTETVKRPKLFCQLKGPGPVYKLPTLVGHEQHDPSKYRNPAYSLRKSLRTAPKSLGPGPVYDVQKMTRRGPERAPAYTLLGRKNLDASKLGPGPCAYNVRKCPPMNHNLRPPAYTMKARKPGKYETDAPAPNLYSLPTCIGPTIPDKRAVGAYTIFQNSYRPLTDARSTEWTYRYMDTRPTIKSSTTVPPGLGLHDDKRKPLGPGPAAYGDLCCDTVKRKNPAYSLKAPYKIKYNTISPGPVHYSSFNTRKNAPKYSFGVRHSECSPPAFSPMDNI